MKFFLTTIILALAAPASAQTTLQKLQPSDPANWAGFGNSIALDGDVAVIGSSTKSVNGLNYAGAVYVFRRQGGAFVEEARLLRPVPEIHDNFGASVAVQGDLLVAGAPDFPYSSFTGTGAVHVYRRVGGVWTQVAELHGSNAHVDSGFGTDVALDGDRILVGANLNSGGCCYVFDWNGISWGETAKFQAPSGGFHFDGYAGALALQGDVALVGASRLTVNGHFNAGMAFIYRRAAGVWSLEAELTAPVPDDNEYFGRAVALDQGLAVIGLPPDNSACLYRHAAGAWPFEIRFKNTPQGGDFGAAVAVEGDLVLVAAPQTGFFADYAGAVYPYRRNGGSWDADPPFIAAGTGVYDGFGHALALDGGLLLAGSSQDPPGYLGVGSVYAMDPTPDLVLELNPNPPESGEDLDLNVRYGAPHASAWVAFSVRGTGSTYVAPLDVVLGLKNPSPFVGPASTDAQGAASWTIPVPLAAAGRAAWFQAVQLRRASNVVSVTVL